MIDIAALVLAAVASCAVPQAEVALQASLAYQAFDSRSGSFGWRSLLGAGCTDAALSLLAAYAAANDARLTVEQRLELAFHSGQTLAFLKRDASALAEARAAYATIAPDSMRLTIIDGFIACRAESYSRAAHCAM